MFLTPILHGNECLYFLYCLWTWLLGHWICDLKLGLRPSFIFNNNAPLSLNLEDGAWDLPFAVPRQIDLAVTTSWDLTYPCRGNRLAMAWFLDPNSAWNLSRASSHCLRTLRLVRCWMYDFEAGLKILKLAHGWILDLTFHWTSCSAHYMILEAQIRRLRQQFRDGRPLIFSFRRPLRSSSAHERILEAHIHALMEQSCNCMVGVGCLNFNIVCGLGCWGLELLILKLGLLPRFILNK